MTPAADIELGVGVRATDRPSEANFVNSFCHRALSLSLSLSKEWEREAAGWGRLPLDSPWSLDWNGEYIEEVEPFGI